MIDQRLLGFVAAPFLRAVYLARVASVCERYRLVLELITTRETSRRDMLTMKLLREHPSTHLESAAVTKETLESRLRDAEAELVNLRAAAPLPAPIPRTDRTTVLAIADLEHLIREFQLIRRRVRRMPPAPLSDWYRETARRPDPLDALDVDRVRAIAMIARGRVVKTCAEIAGLRHGVEGLRYLLAPRKPSQPQSEDLPAFVCKLRDLQEGCGKSVEAYGRTIAMFKHGGALYAIDDHCPHRGGPLHQGEIENNAAICPLHGWAFDLATGRLRGNPRLGVRTYDVDVNGEDVFVRSRKAPT